MNKPTDEERDDLDRLLRVLMTTDDEDPENGEPGWSLTVMRNQILAAGFRRRGAVTDEKAHAGYRAFCEARNGAPLVPGEYEATFSRLEFAWVRAALEVGHE